MMEEMGGFGRGVERSGTERPKPLRKQKPRKGDSDGEERSRGSPGKGVVGEEIKRWTAKRKAAVVVEILKGLTTPAEVARKHGLTVAEVEGWIDAGLRGMEDRLRAHPRELEAAHEAEKKELLARIGELSMEVSLLKKTQGIVSKESGDGSW